MTTNRIFVVLFVQMWQDQSKMPLRKKWLRLLSKFFPMREHVVSSYINRVIEAEGGFVRWDDIEAYQESIKREIIMFRSDRHLPSLEVSVTVTFYNVMGVIENEQNN